MSGERLEAFTAVEREVNGEKKTFWTKIGVAFPGRGNSVYSLQLDALPVNGKIVLMVPREREQGGGGAQQSSGTQRSGGRQPGDDSW
jgi:hypothetical protein